MVTGNFTIAMNSIKSAKWRSFLTMLGIIIGVVSVVTIVSIGEGVKKQIAGQINRMGPDLITIRPGKADSQSLPSQLAGSGVATNFSGSPLTENDLKVIGAADGVASTVPMSLLSGSPKTDERTYDSGYIFGTSDQLPDMINLKVEFGAFFSDEDGDKPVAVIGKTVAEDLFKETVPIGRSMEIRGQSFIVLGVFEEFQTASFASSADYNRSVFIPQASSKKLNNNQTNIQQIFAKPERTEDTERVAENITEKLNNTHAGQGDFSVLKQQDSLEIANSVLNLLTGLVSGVAAISLIVGGIGIMNIMLVSVTERTREIGVRKAVGATNNQILSQFVIEAAVLSLVGGIIGVAASVLANFLIRVFSDLEPVVTLPVMIIAVLVSLFVGVLFGTTPALKAARKDPIQALRQLY
jgi:putative ABC transport system permease protein